METDLVVNGCKIVLANNQNGGHTMPAPDLYPHQWLWDSCFIAIGLRHYDPKRAKIELLEMFKGQWSNGMIPHMIFDPSKKYRTDRDVWRSFVSPYSTEISTSGITQPPVLADAVTKVGQKLSKIDAQKFYKKVLPNLINYHTWLMTERDPHGEGLVLQIHPWETGLDNTPPWMTQLHEHSKPWWIWSIEKLHMDSVVNFFRRDTRHVPPGQRISNVEALMVFDLIRRFRRKNYDIGRILHRSMFCIEDVGFNSILARNNQLIIELAELSRRKLPPSFIELVEKQKNALQGCWSEKYQTFFSRDFITHGLIEEQTISSLLTLYSGAISAKQAASIVRQLTDDSKFATPHPIPSVPIDNPDFSSVRYWQGPTWVNTNWLIIDGLRSYGYNELAAKISRDTVDLVTQHGPYEYFSALDGKPLGANNFSWTAALTIDLLLSKVS